MAILSIVSATLLVILVTTFSSPASAHLSVSYYASTCPSVFKTVRTGIRSAIKKEARMGASLLRMVFHDCFVNGCDGSVLLADIPGSFVGERSAPPNPTLRGFDVIDNIKSQVDRVCGANVVSCSDILVISARDSIVELGGPKYPVPLGRRDARTANITAATNDLPAPSDDLQTLIRKFGDKGFTPRELVALSGAHTVGQASCATFRDHIYNGTSINPSFARTRRATCPRTGGDGNLAPLDLKSPNAFDNDYFQALLNRKGLLNSDQVLFNGGSTDSIVTTYSKNRKAFSTDFKKVMIKLGNLSPLTGSRGEIRRSCQRAN